MACFLGLALSSMPIILNNDMLHIRSPQYHMLRKKDSLKNYQIWGGAMLAHNESNVKLEQLYFIKERL
jgi:hypothetical protein